MAEIRKSVLIEHSAAQMYELVERVEDYPEFLPWCGGGEVVQRTPTGMLARLHVHYRGIRTKFSTDNTNEPGRSILMRLHDGPFRRLEGSWHFIPLAENACKIEFQLHYEFSSTLLEKVLGPVFNHIINTFVEAFVRRADQLGKEKKQA